MKCGSLQNSMDILQRLFKCASGKTRIDILLLLMDEGEKSVSEIATYLRRKLNTVSRNLSILEKDNFVASRKTSSNVFYSLKEDPKYFYNLAILEVFRLRLQRRKRM